MSDDERLLEIATRLMAGILGNQTLKVTSKHEGASDIEAIAACSFAAADALMSEWRERTGAQGRGQDVSDDLLDRCLAGIDRDTWYGTYRDLLSIQRARAAGKGE